MLNETASGLANHAKLARIKHEGDSSGIQQFRQETADRLSMGLAQCKDNWNKCSIRRELLLLADLEIYDGLINGLPERIEDGLSLGLFVGKEAMESEIKYNSYALPSKMDANFSHWLSMAILILACDNQTSMRRFMNQLNSHLMNDSIPDDFHSGDVERMTWTMEVLTQSNMTKPVLKVNFNFFSEHPYLAPARSLAGSFPSCKAEY